MNKESHQNQANYPPINAILEFQKKIILEEKKRAEFKQNYGDFPMPVFCDTPLGFMVTINSKIFKHDSKVSFHQFLLDNLKRLFSDTWFEEEQKKSDPHSLIHWFRSSKTSGRLRLQLLSLAFDLYLIENNSILQAKIIERLKIKYQFEGARFELLVTAICIRAGLKITEFYDESKGQKCAEFVVYDHQQNFYFDVEAKRSHASRNNYGTLVNQALQKIDKNNMVVFVDLNTSKLNADKLIGARKLEGLLKQVIKSPDGKDLFSLIIFINDPYEDIQNEYLHSAISFLPDSPQFDPLPNEVFEKLKAGLFCFRMIPSEWT